MGINHILKMCNMLHAKHTHTDSFEIESTSNDLSESLRRLDVRLNVSPPERASLWGFVFVCVMLALHTF